MIVEPAVYLIAACLLSLRPLFRLVFKDVDFGTIYTRLLNYITRISSFSNDKDVSLSARTAFGIDTSADRDPRSGFIRLDETPHKGNSGLEQEDFATGDPNRNYHVYQVEGAHRADIERV